MSDVAAVDPKVEPMGNSPEARNPDGSLKDSQNPKLEPKPEPAKDQEAKADAKADDKAKPAAGAPEKYDFKPPEGYSLDEKLVGEVTPLFKEMGLTQENAQKLVDFYSKNVIAAANKPYDAFTAMREDWRKEVIADKTIGNGKDGLSADASGSIGRLIDTLPNAKDFREALTLTGAGDNPAFVRAFYDLSKKLGEGTSVQGRGPSPEGQGNAGKPASAAQAMYPNLPSSAR